MCPGSIPQAAEAGAAVAAAFAPAKINLALHVTGRRADGYHQLDSLVVFADCGDAIAAVPADAPGIALEIGGPFGAALDPPADNLVLRAARAYAARFGPLPPLRLQLTKRLPVASGIGGGSADAAATLRLLASLSGTTGDPGPELFELAAALGADVPMCLLSRPLRATGIGERLTRWTGLPDLPLVLVNPGVAVATPAVFARLQRRDNAALPADLPRLAGVSEVAAFLATTRNDLEAAAIEEAPVIASVREAVRAAEGCRFARMSGSGATVFGVFADSGQAAAAAENLARAHPDWWVVAATAAGG